MKLFRGHSIHPVLALEMHFGAQSNSCMSDQGLIIKPLSNYWCCKQKVTVHFPCKQNCGQNCTILQLKFGQGTACKIKLLHGLIVICLPQLAVLFLSYSKDGWLKGGGIMSIYKSYRKYIE